MIPDELLVVSEPAVVRVEYLWPFASGAWAAIDGAFIRATAALIGTGLGALVGRLVLQVRSSYRSEGSYPCAYGTRCRAESLSSTVHTA